MLDPLAQRLVITQRPPNAEPKITGVGVHKSRSDAPIAAMAVNQRHVTLPHLPNLLQNLAENSVEHDFGWMVAVKVDFHLRPPKLLGPRSNQSVIRKRIPGLSSSVHGFHGTGSIPILSFTASRRRCLQPRYFSVVCTDTWPNKNRICSSSPPAV